MNRHGMKAWLYLLPALLFLSIFMIYPLIDVFVYSAEEGYNFASQTYFGTGLYNYSYVLHDPYFLQAVKKHLPSGYHHRSPLHGACASDFPGLKLHQGAAGFVPDRFFSCPM
ncbi:MAG: hypothetical protein ACLSA0_11795 [Eisenbergiella massiliensis]